MLEILFDLKEFIVLGGTAYDIEACQFEGVVQSPEKYQYVALNPLKENTTRADRNVAAYRNFLVEFDELPLEEQLPYVLSKGLPFSTQTFSGNKSYHFVISLEEPVATKKEYDALVRWLYKALPEADQSCKNPSRFTRLGGGKHRKTRDLQTVVEVRSRISHYQLVTWLKLQCEEPVIEAGTKGRKRWNGLRTELHPATVGFIKTGGRRGHRQKNIYIAACDLRDCGYSLDEAKFMLLNKITQVYSKEGRDPKEIKIKERAIEDAFNKGGN